MSTINRVYAADVAFQALSLTEWRVCDRRYPVHSIDALLGFVVKSGLTFELTRIAVPGEAIPLPSLEAVAEFFANDGLPRTARSGRVVP
ncbi:MAG: hypothetical protein H7146_08500 [Burkholderiaceae bacterium]|nr:hypothetical protein [Microbacteriaceae bacterium]